MSIFDAYEDEFSGLARDISAKLSHASTYEDTHDDRLRVIVQASSILAQASDLVKQMEVEVRSETDPGSKRAMTDKVGAVSASQYQHVLDHAARSRRSFPRPSPVCAAR